MAGGVWFDVALVILTAATLLAFYRARSKTPVLEVAGPPATEKAARRFEKHYSKVVRQAGFDPHALRAFYWTAKLVLGVLLPLAVMEASSTRLPALWLVAPALAGFLVPDLFLLNARRVRRRRVRMSLSFFLDLLVALLHSGSGLEEAFAKAGRGLRFGRPNPLADEVELVALELDTGKQRSDAFQALAERTGVTELKAVGAALRLGLRLGTSLEKTLAAQAGIQRTKRREEAIKQINRAAIQAIVPTLLCGFPILALLVFFPAALEFLEALELLREATP